jgi:hypothetical protein
VVTTDDFEEPAERVRPAECGGSQRYEICVRGRLGERWAAWFDGLDVTADTNGTTVLSGDVVDQAALHGLLHKLRDIGLPLVSLRSVSPHDAGIADLPDPSPDHTTGATR